MLLPLVHFGFRHTYSKTVRSRLISFRRARSAGYHALVVTVDTPVLGRREHDFRNQFELPAGITMQNLNVPPALPGEYKSPMVRSLAGRSIVLYVARCRMVCTDCKDAGLCERRSSPGGTACVKCGVSGIIVSNHGGRQLDGAIATLDALPEIVSHQTELTLM